MTDPVPSKELVAQFKCGDVVRWNAIALHGTDRDGWTVEGMAQRIGLLPVYRVRKGRETGEAVQHDLESMPGSAPEPPQAPKEMFEAWLNAPAAGPAVSPDNPYTEWQTQHLYEAWKAAWNARAFHEPPAEQPSVTEIIRQMKGRAADSEGGTTIEVLLSDLRSVVTGMRLAGASQPPGDG